MARPAALVAAALAVLALRGDAPASGPPLPAVIYLGVAAEDQDRSFAQFGQALARQRAPGTYRLIHLTLSADAPPAQVAAVFAQAARGSVVVAPTSDSAVLAQQLIPQQPRIWASLFAPHRIGLAHSLKAPGHGATGVWFGSDDHAKRLELLADAIPGLRRVALLADRSWVAAQMRDGTLATAARTRGLAVRVVLADTPAELDARMRSPEAATFQAWYVPATTLSYFARQAVIDHLHRLGAWGLFTDAADVRAGGLMAYAPDTTFAYDALATLTGRVLDGEDPATLPVERPKRHLLVVRTGPGTERTPIAPAVLRRADVIVQD